MSRSRYLWAAVILALLTALLASTLTACSSTSPIGERNNQATLALLRFEKIDAEFSGVVYREINDFAAFIGDAKTPVLVTFYNPLNPANAQIIPLLEELADDLQGQLAIIWIDATAQPYLAESLGAKTLPQFTILVNAEVQASLIGFGLTGAKELANLLSPFLKSP